MSGLLHAGLFMGPRLVVSGRGITTTGGHAAALSVRADGADEVRQAVREEMRAGADWIKRMLTGGSGTRQPGSSTRKRRRSKGRCSVASTSPLRPTPAPLTSPLASSP
jgi:imidazolonepropionase-like amidohydrolase